MRTIIIGDIHGCSRGLIRILETVHPVPGRDRIVLLGDLFDRGPDSRGVLQAVKQLAGQFGEAFVLLRGNHEDYLLQAKLTLKQKMIWEQVGRRATVLSFQRAGERMEDAAPWLEARVRLWWRGGELQCVHAGIMVEPLEANDLYTLIHDHHIVFENGYAGPLTVTGHVALEQAAWFAGDRETVALLEDGREYPLPDHGVICIDTGCGKGGRLTAMIVREEHFSLCSVSEDGTDVRLPAESVIPENPRRMPEEGNH